MRTVAAVLACVALAACGPGSEVKVKVPASITVKSSAFAEGEPIPPAYSCKGRNISPPLEWSDVPAQAREMALVVDDPDAPRGTFTHWIVLGVSPATTSLREGSLPAGGRQARNSAGRAQYAGPCPPSGTHHYRFTVYALDAPLNVAHGAETGKALGEIERHAIASGRLIGVFSA